MPTTQHNHDRTQVTAVSGEERIENLLWESVRDQRPVTLRTEVVTAGPTESAAHVGVTVHLKDVHHDGDHGNGRHLVFEGSSVQGPFGPGWVVIRVHMESGEAMMASPIL